MFQRFQVYFQLFWYSVLSKWFVFPFQALKGAPKGIVRIGVSKPLPVPDSSATLSQEGSGSTVGDDNTEVRSEMSDMDVDNLPLSPSRNVNDEIPPPLPTRYFGSFTNPYLSACPSVCLSVGLSIRPVNLSVYLSDSLFVYLYTWLSICQIVVFFRPSICIKNKSKTAMAAKFLLKTGPFQSLKFYKFLNKYCLTFSPLPEDDEDRTKRPSFPTSPTKSVTPTSSPTKPPTLSKLEEHPITRQTISLPAAERLIGSSASAGAVVTARSVLKRSL